MNASTERCQAMRDAGIEDPESKAGINFCVTRCPYEKGCVVFDNVPTERDELRKMMIVFAKRMYSRGVSVKDISLILRKTTRTIQRYLTL